MMPAAVIGIQAIWTAHTVKPRKPNKATSMINIKATPCHEKRVYKLRSIQSSGVPWPKRFMVSRFLDSLRYNSAPVNSTVLMPCTCGLCGSSACSHLAWCLR